MDERTETGPIISDFADDADMLEIIEMFVEELPDRIAEIERSWSDGEVDEVKRIAHQLKGASGGYGFPIVGEQAARVEALLKQGEEDVQKLRAELDDLVSLCSRVAVS